MFSQTGFLQKMRIEANESVQYSLVLDNQPYPLNQYLGKQLYCTFLGAIKCIHCQRSIKKTYNQGYCYPCFIKLAVCDLCVMKPELCHYHKGTCREPEWGLAHCMQPHVVYLANTSQVKVGITRLTQVPTRWLDQGASQAVPLFGVTKRYYAGLIEIELAKRFADKTNWRNLLKGVPEQVDLEAMQNVLYKEFSQNQLVFHENIPQEAIKLESSSVRGFVYPVQSYPEKIKSINLDKTPRFSGTLIGLKGQYLLLDIGVINLRKYTGYQLQVKIS